MINLGMFLLKDKLILYLPERFIDIFNASENSGPPTVYNNLFGYLSYFVCDDFHIAYFVLNTPIKLPPRWGNILKNGIPSFL
jgi:hypothetical protein